MRIEICNERLLPRFGVDRLLVLLAHRLADSGHEVSFACLRCDKTMLLPITPDVSVIPVPEGLDMGDTEAAVAGTVMHRWQQRAPDAVVIGGWPFFQTAAQARAFRMKSIFIDAGAVAQHGLTEPLLGIQQELRRIRQLTLPSVDRVLAISDFIRLTQSEPDRGSDTGVKTILLGADHMAHGTFGGDEQAGSGQDLLRRLKEMIAEGQQLLLALGRFEQHGYKNSPAVYDILRLLREQVPTVRLLLLDAGQDCAVPDDLKSCIELLGAPDDLTLQEIMRLCSVGISTSLWEGFNLPIAEMQWLDSPAVAFNIGAHPEVIAEPWLLAEDVREMVAKILALLRGEAPPQLTSRFAEFRERRQWRFTLDAWENEITGAPRFPAASAPILLGEPRERRIVLVDVTNASLDPANPGVIRVARRLCSELQHEKQLELIFAAWSRDRGEYAFLDPTRRGLLQNYEGPRDGLSLLAAWKGDMTPEVLVASFKNLRPRSPVLLMPEVMFDGQAEARVNWARAHGFKTAAILYDLIPIYYPELCDTVVRDGFPPYLQALVGVDAVWSISDFTLAEFRRYLGETGLDLPPIHETILLPGQFGDWPRNQEGQSGNHQFEIRILSVSTLEPRKNHLKLLEAVQLLQARRPELPLRLVLIGNRYAGSPEIAEKVQAVASRDPKIEWLGTVDDARLAKEFEQCAFTVYPSLVEGFGLPILESLWLGRPCLAHSGGVMEELALPGGCLTTDMTDTESITRSLERLATDKDLLAQLRKQATERRIATWQHYADEVAARLRIL